MSRLLVLILVAGCGRLGFDALGTDPRRDASPTPFDGQLSFDAPEACAAYAVPASCSTGSTNATSMSVSSFTVCAVHGSTRLACWGRNVEGELGFCPTTDHVPQPTETFGFQIAQLVVAEEHTCVLLTDGQLWCWGSRYEGESGNGISATPDPVPHRVGGTWLDVSSERYFTCAVATDRALWCWGHNDEGQLGIGDTTDRGFPTRVGTDTDWESVSAGGSQTCALKTTGQAYCWGLNSYGELGDGTMQQRLTPGPVLTATRFATLAVGKTHSCGIDGAGGVWCWGNGQLGETGNGTSTGELVPQRVANTYSSLASGSFHTCAIEATNGSLYCWGDNSAQTLIPDGATSRLASPTLMAAGPYVEVAAGGYTTCVRQPDSQVFCFGDNLENQLGNGNTTTTTVFQPVCFPN